MEGNMADTVQYLMEEMIPELEDLNKYVNESCTASMLSSSEGDGVEMCALPTAARSEE